MASTPTKPQTQTQLKPQGQTQTAPPPQPGTFCWNELMTKDIAGAKKFYTALFGWKTEDMDMPMGKYTMFSAGPAPAGGLMELKPQQKTATPAWMPYVTVEDVDKSTKKAETLGAKVAVPPTDIPNMGRFSIITDPTGASIGLYKSKM